MQPVTKNDVFKAIRELDKNKLYTRNRYNYKNYKRKLLYFY